MQPSFNFPKRHRSLIVAGLFSASFSCSAAILQTGDVLSIPVLPSADLFVGKSTTGTLEINGGSTQSNVNSRIGDEAAASGHVIVTGTGSDWTNTADLFVGSFGQGELRIEDSASVSSTNTKIADQMNSHGSVVVSGQGSNLTSNAELFVGSFGEGSLTIEQGAVVTNTNGKIGDQVVSNGSVRVSGAGSQWNNKSELFVGSFGDGELYIEAGATVSSVNGKIADQQNSTGSASVSGAGSQWNISADLFVGQNGEGSLTILNQAEVNVTNAARVSSQSTLNLGLGKLTAQNLELDGILNIALTQQGNGLLNISNTAVLGGVLEFDFLGAFLPEVGDSFTFLQAGFISGLFDEIIFAGYLLDTFAFNFSADYSSFSVSSVGSTSVPEPTPLLLVFTALGLTLLRRKKSNS